MRNPTLCAFCAFCGLTTTHRLDFRLGCRFTASPENTYHTRQQPMQDITNHDREEHVLRVKKDQHANRKREDDRAHAANTSADCLETREAPGADHQHTQEPDERHQQCGIKVSPIWTIVDDRRGREVNECCNQSSGHRYRQTDEAFLIDFRRTFSEDARARRLHVETRETKGAADQVHKREKPGETMKLAAFGESCSITPNVSEHGGCEPKRNDVSDRIELNTDLGCCLSESRNATVKHVKQERPADRDGSAVEVSSCSDEIGSRAAEQLKAAQRRHH